MSAKVRTEQEEIELLEQLTIQEQYVLHNKIRYFFTDEGKYARTLYPKHIEFFTAGKHHLERLFSAANQVGKSTAGAYEVTLHLTGLYDQIAPWWTGYKFLNPINCIAANTTAQKTREVQQTMLLGENDAIGTGLIPKECIDMKSIKYKQNGNGAIESVKIKHISGRESRLVFKDYAQGREAFQGTTEHVVWLDEEPPINSGIYSEAITRLVSAKGGAMMLITSTPVKRCTPLVLSFLPEGLIPYRGIHPDNPSKYAVAVGWKDVPHVSPTMQKALLATYSEHEWLARSTGLPGAGVSNVYNIPESEFVIEPFEIPFYWPKYYGFDYGYNTAAAIFIAIDPNTNISYVYDELYMKYQVPTMQAEMIKKRGGTWMVGAIDPACLGTDAGSGKKWLEIYEETGLNLVLAANPLEPGISKNTQLLTMKQQYVFNTCREFLAEYRLYGRDEDGKVDKKNSGTKRDHCMDAWRYANMTGMSHAEPTPNIDKSQEENNFNNYYGRDEYTGY